MRCKKESEGWFFHLGLRNARTELTVSVLEKSGKRVNMGKQYVKFSFEQVYSRCRVDMLVDVLTVII